MVTSGMIQLSWRRRLDSGALRTLRNRNDLVFFPCASSRGYRGPEPEPFNIVQNDVKKWDF